MKIGFIQFKPEFGDVDANLKTMIRYISSAHADLLVLPELATTGYTFATKKELAEVSEPFDHSPSLNRLHERARKQSCAIVIGFAESSEDVLYNSAAFLKPDGTRHLYRKVHLFGAENLLFQPGDIPFEVHELNGIKIGIMVCFDWFFPESARVLALKGAQIICHPVNFILPWGQQAMIIRSLENRVFIVTANRYGTEGSGDNTFTFTGESQITSPRGEVLAHAPKCEDAVVIIDINPNEALNKRLNKYNDLFVNRRPDFYKHITTPSYRE